MDNTDLKIYSVNVRGLNTYKKRTILYDWLNDAKYDVIFLQETHFVEKQEYVYNSRWFGDIIHCYSESVHSRGVSILIRKNSKIELINYNRSTDGRKLLVNIRYNDKIITLINIYAPNNEKDRIEFFKKLTSWINRHSKNLECIVLCGDFNCQIDSERNDKSVDILKKIMKTFYLKDSWLHLGKSNEQGFTWCDGNNVPRSRIDYVFISEYSCFPLNNMYLRKTPAVDDSRLTDHLGIIFELCTFENPRGVGYWKLNTSLLHDEFFCKKLRKFIQEIFVNCEINDPVNKWEYFKICLKTFCSNYSKNIAKNKKKRIDFIEKQIKKIESQPYSEINMNYKRILEKEIDDYYANKCSGAYIRSRSTWIEKGEKSTSYFLNLEKKQQSSNTITKLKDDHGIEYINTTGILDCLIKFYETLYSSDRKDNHVNIQEYLESIDCKQITKSEQKMCDDIPTLQECKMAVDNMKNNKSPGQDGIPVEFYKVFWNDIKDIYYKSLLKSIEIGMLPFSQRNAVISLIHKKGEKDNPKNYRPISLTNVDYKIFAHVLAHRLQKIACNTIGREQSAYIKGRYIGENARLILDVFEYHINNDLDGILLFLDFEKAFDSVDYNFMFKTLEKFNFGDKFIAMVKTLYNRPIFRIKNNGWISKSCEMQRGIRQGCPVSALLFVFVIEILAIKIRNNNEIKGLSFQKLPLPNENNIKIVQHADDCTNMLKDTNSLIKLLEMIANFSNVAGPKLNIEKTECLLTGKYINIYSKDSYLHGIKITKTCIKSLGIYLGHDKIECYHKNWTNRLEKLEKILSVWKRRKLTLFGKCTIINTLAISKILYNASILENPKEDFFKTVSKLIYNFIWKKRDRIKRNTLIGKIQQGGIGVVDIESKFYATKASWISRILDIDSVTHRTLNDILKQHNISIFDVLKTSEYNNPYFFKMLKLPMFYENIFSAFNKSKKQRDLSSLKRDEFLSQFIWNNILFKHKSKTLCFKNWIQSGILYIKDIFDEYGEMHNISYFTNKLKKKNNVFCEYIILKRTIKTFKENFDCSHSQYINIKPNVQFLFKNNVVKSAQNMKSKFYYSLFVNMKFQKPLYENKWKKCFNVNNASFADIYTTKIGNMYEKRISEFNYKLLHGILNNNVYVSKWNKDVSPLCENCNTNEDIKHLLYECRIVKSIWEKINSYLKFDISWKTIVLGYYNEINEKTTFLNNFISFVCFCIYKYKMKCRIQNEAMLEQSLVNTLKKELLIQHIVISNIGKNKSNVYKDIGNFL